MAIIINNCTDSEIRVELSKKINIWKKYTSDDNLKLPENIVEIVKHLDYDGLLLELIPDDNIEKLKLTPDDIKNTDIDVKNINDWMPILKYSCDARLTYFYINTNQQKIVSHYLTLEHNMMWGYKRLEVYDLNIGK